MEGRDGVTVVGEKDVYTREMCRGNGPESSRVVATGRRNVRIQKPESRQDKKKMSISEKILVWKRKSRGWRG